MQPHCCDVVLDSLSNDQKLRSKSDTHSNSELLDCWPPEVHFSTCIMNPMMLLLRKNAVVSTQTGTWQTCVYQHQVMPLLLVKHKISRLSSSPIQHYREEKYFSSNSQAFVSLSCVLQKTKRTK